MGLGRRRPTDAGQSPTTVPTDPQPPPALGSPPIPMPCHPAPLAAMPSLGASPSHPVEYTTRPGHLQPRLPCVVGCNPAPNTIPGSLPTPCRHACPKPPAKIPGTLSWAKPRPSLPCSVGPLPYPAPCLFPQGVTTLALPAWGVSQGGIWGEVPTDRLGALPPDRAGRACAWLRIDWTRCVPPGPEQAEQRNGS